MKHLRRTLFLLLCVPLLAHGQVLRLAQQQTGATKVMAAPGDTITVEVMADLGVQTASGLRFFVKVPRDDFIILETTGQQLKRTAPSPPFKQGRLFEGAVVELVLWGHVAVWLLYRRWKFNLPYVFLVRVIEAITLLACASLALDVIHLASFAGDGEGLRPGLGGRDRCRRKYAT